MSALANLEPGEHRLECPDCGRGPRDKTMGVTVEHGGAAVGHCFRCEYVETYRPDGAAVHRPGKAISRPVAPLKRETLSQYGRDLLDGCTDPRGTIGERYLQHRGCELPPADGHLRYHAALVHPSGFVGPGLVALVTHAQTRVPMSLHRTWIKADGTKADCDPPRLLLGGHSKKFGVIRLWPDECVTYGLAVAEGIESALALARDFTPVWACIDAGNMAAMPVLPGIETLVIGADHDAAGIKAAATCADRWAAAGVDVRVVAPAAAGHDWADVREVA